MRIFFFLILFLSVSMACNATISQYVPAIVGNGGQLVNVTVSIIPGEGDVYVNVYPRTGITTQESIEQAVTYAHFFSKQSRGCDVVVDFDENNAGFIEGPSAGTALTVMTVALLENKSLRNDTIMTGTIDQFGNVGPVGGLYEKAKEAATIGASYFITPVENFYESLLLNKVEEDYGIEIIEARTVQEVIGFMTENKTSKTGRFCSHSKKNGGN
jgi:uncharacterized protein